MRKEAVDLILERNPNAFRPKIETVDSKHIKGCHCKKSGCNKKCARGRLRLRGWLHAIDPPRVVFAPVCGSGDVRLPHACAVLSGIASVTKRECHAARNASAKSAGTPMGTSHILQITGAHSRARSLVFRGPVRGPVTFFAVNRTNHGYAHAAAVSWLLRLLALGGIRWAGIASAREQTLMMTTTTTMTCPSRSASAVCSHYVVVGVTQECIHR